MKRFLKILCILLVLSVMLSFSSNILQRKYSSQEYSLFFEKADQLDVLFFGPSVVHYSIYPAQLWHDYGITSYNMGNDSERLTMTYYTLLNALDYANPKAAVFDLTGIVWAGTKRDGTLVDHNFLDALPLTRNKLAEINDLFSGKERLEYLFPFYLYHSRWNELDDRDFFRHRYVQHGADFLNGIESVEKVLPGPNPAAENEYTLYEIENIKRIFTLCNSRGIEPIFIYLPNSNVEYRQFCADQLKKLGATFYDLQDVDCIQWKRDFSDPSHLNYYGGEKITNLLGQLLSETYSIPDHRSDRSISTVWDADYSKYLEYVNSYLEIHQEIYTAISPF